MVDGGQASQLRAYADDAPITVWEVWFLDVGSHDEPSHRPQCGLSSSCNTTVVHEAEQLGCSTITLSIILTNSGAPPLPQIANVVPCFTARGSPPIGESAAAWLVSTPESER
ncbi:hypothetical protein ANOBCDAF_04112 [Pleomorphomonas sp. T1.2MG-36]|uniref:hypothetical protein n=1 Tax=Pleomorphomonas sp. T1.2MG-36 TaxID=3041167 RepID=UPI00247777B2|nr:hypothetical protein [Pleomorphomonas sp. T1.2MG-36]CAI9417948.1 hypothetical protein ANOBCDAF_04112 [Pleomorphomonas sp. T1.2MG-36]